MILSVIHFYYWSSTVGIYHILSLYQLMDIRVISSILIITNNAAMNICMQGS